MKKIVSILSAVILLVNTVKPNNNDSGAHIAVALANNAARVYSAAEAQKRSEPSERNFRRNIYWLDKNNPNFMRLSTFKKDISYYIPTFADHIKLLEEKIVANKSGLTSWAMIKALLTSTLSGLSSYSFYHLYKNPGFLFSYTDKRLHADALVTCGIFTVLFGGLAVHYLNKVRKYKDRLIERLERDKRLLAAFEKENAEFSKSHVINAALKLIDAVSATIA